MLFKNQKQIIQNGQTTELKRVRKDILKILTSVLNAINAYNAVKKRFAGKNITLGSKKFDSSNFKFK